MAHLCPASTSSSARMESSGTPTKSLSLMPGPGPRYSSKPKSFHLTLIVSDFDFSNLQNGANFPPQVFLGNHDDGGVTESRLDRVVSAQFIRLLPHDFQNGIYLRLEIMGCGEGRLLVLYITCVFFASVTLNCILSSLDHDWLTSPTPPSPVSPAGGCREKEFQCRNGRCVPAGRLGVVCDGVNDCGDSSDETHCGELPTLTHF